MWHLEQGPVLSCLSLTAKCTEASHPNTFKMLNVAERLTSVGLVRYNSTAFLETMEMLGEDRHWHSYLRKTMNL